MLYLSLVEAAGKQFRDKFPHVTLWSLKVSELTKMCNECFWKKGNRTLDRHKFFSQMQQPGETLHQFWHALNVLAAPCDFGEITKTLFLDMFIQHMTNKKVQEKLCTEPKEPEQALEVAIAFEEGIKNKKAEKLRNAKYRYPKTSVKKEPIFALERTNQRECFR